MTKKNHNSIGDKVKKLGTGNLAASLLMTLFFVSLSIVFYVFLHDSIKDSIVKDNMLNAQRSVALYERYLDRGKQLLEYESYQVSELISQGASSEEILEHMTYATGILVKAVDEDSTGLYAYINGEYLDGSGWVPDDDYVPTDRPWYRDAMVHRGSLRFVDPYLDAQTGNVIMTMVETLGDSSSVMALDMSLNEIQRITEDLSGSDPDATLFLVDSSGTVIAHPDHELIGVNYSDLSGELTGFVVNMILKGNSGYFETRYGGQQYMAYCEKLSDCWYCVSLTNAEDKLMILHILLAIIVVVIAVTLFIFSVLFVNLIRGKANTDILNQRLSTAADIYMSMHDIDVVNDKIYAIKTDENEMKALPEYGHDRAQINLYTAMDILSNDSSRAAMHEFVNLETLDERLKEDNTTTIEFLNHENLWCRGRFIASEKDKDGKLTNVLLLFEKIDVEKRNRDRLLKMSQIDSMTGINNRGCGERLIREQLSLGHYGAFVVLDIDSFKNINDTYGHNVGDKVIVAVAQALKNVFRSTDVVMRLGGDEFAVYARDVSDKESVHYIIDRLISNISAIDISEMNGSEVCISVGVSFFAPGESLGFDELYKRADESSYMSKEHIGSYVTYYGDNL